jgi:phosphatidylinositol alpha-1,6-mannosyltransferase
MSHRLAAAMAGFQTRVLTLQADGAASFDAASGLDLRRVRAGSDRRGANAVLNAAAVREAVRFRPHATLSMHIVVSPGAAIIRRALGAPTVQYFHAKEITGKPRLARFAASRADAVIAVSAYTASLIANTGARPACLRLIPPGVELPAAQAPPREARPTIVTIARLNDRYKGHDVLIEALARVRSQVKELQWVVIGDGQLRTELEERARAAGLAGSASFLGAVSDQVRDSWLARCDLLAMPSRLPDGGLAGEGFGMVYLEAAAHAKPVVAGNVGGALDAVADGESGLLVDPTDPDAVAGAITKLLREPELAQRMGARGAQRARTFAWPLIAARVEALVHELLQGKRDARSDGRARKQTARTAA